MAAPSVAALQDVATQLRIDSVASTSRRRQRPPDDVPVGRRHHGGAVLLGDALRSEESAESRQRSLRPVEGACRADPLRRLGRGRTLPARAADGAAHASNRISKGIRRRGCPSSTWRPGSLGQGICAAIGIALNARRIGSAYRTYVLLGDGEIAEGSVWEAADAASHYKLDNLCAIVDANALGQSQPTEFGHDLNRIAARWSAFGWKAHRGRRPRHRGRPEGTGRGARDQRPADRARGADAERQGPVVDRRQGRLARQGAEERRGDRQGDQGARGAADAHRCEARRSAGRAAAAKPDAGRRLRHAAGARLQDGRSRRHPRGVGHGARRRRQARPAHRRARRRREELHVQRSLREGRTRSFLRDVHRRAGHGRSGDGLRGARRRSRSRRRSPASSTAPRISSAWPGSRC